MENFKNYLDLINIFLPDLKIEKYEVITSGFHSVAVIVNDEFVFRFPLDKEISCEYIGERDILEKIKSYISLPIPSLYIYEEKDILFSKHKIINGLQYTKLNIEQKEKAKINISKDIALFLSQLHSINVDDFPVKQIRTIDYKIEDHLELLVDFLKDDKRIKSLKDAILFVKKYNDFKENENVLCHNDLTEFNVLINTEKNNIAGIIDFGNSSRRNFSVDFASLFDFYFIKDIADEYQKLTGRTPNLKYALSIQKLRYCTSIYKCLLGKRNPLKLKAFLGWFDDLVKISI